ncbi:hypothetical protein [Portibacter marinus]|uniref:hypothetical protein n=1 Tax=Portibacter marinus TaxID=2898660 RepID=UPI001F23DFB5|nr:hypothetical protein [Portibacter marinus]
MVNSIVVAATPHLKKSLNFYQKLNYTALPSQERYLFQDHQMILEVNDDRKARTGLRFYKDTWEKEVKALMRLTEVKKKSQSYYFNDFSGVRIELKEGLSYISTDGSGPSYLGNFAGVSLEGMSISQMLSIYELIGFKTIMGDENSGWISISNEEGFTISLMDFDSCPHQFYNPSLTYFNGKDNLKVIDKIKELDISVTEEITYFNKDHLVDNIIIRDPGGLGFFIFSD